MISGASGNTSVIGVGSRPWLQKVAALTVAVSLTIATVDTFKIAEKQYDSGFQDATALTDAVADGMEIRVVRVISDTCLWLAQAQTLIRLFPRHKEKVMIKWTAFALILLDLIFSILNSFVYGNAKTRPRTFVDTVPALNYLFAIALSILYMAWVLYYSISKRRFAFFHPKMRNICLMAVLSLTAILIPVVFFVLDIAKPNVAGWGNYVRWVGAAAASVVVWEWVERIEALERDENKDGILGREIFDGDEMLESTRSAATRRDMYNGPGRGTSTGLCTRREHDMGTNSPPAWNSLTSMATRVGRARISRYRARPSKTHRSQPAISDIVSSQQPNAARTTLGISSQADTPPPTTVSPVSRADTNSAASTVYRIHYHPSHVATPPIREAVETPEPSLNAHQIETSDGPPARKAEAEEISHMQERKPRTGWPLYAWQTISNRFGRQRSSPPVEVSQALSTNAQTNAQMPFSPELSGQSPQRQIAGLSMLERLRHKHKARAEEAPLPVTVIPWQPRGQAYLERIEKDGHSADNGSVK